MTAKPTATSAPTRPAIASRAAERRPTAGLPISIRPPCAPASSSTPAISSCGAAYVTPSPGEENGELDLCSRPWPDRRLRQPGADAIVSRLAVLRSHGARWLSKDVMAGLILTALLVPQGIACADLAGLPDHRPVHLDASASSAKPFRPCKILVLGPDSSLGPMSPPPFFLSLGADGDPARAVALAAILSLLMGAMTGTGRRSAARVRGRPSLQAHHDRLHERPGPDHPGGPSCRSCSASPSQGRKLHRRVRGLRQRARPKGETVPAALVIGLSRPGVDPGLPAMVAEGSGRAGRGRPVHPGRQGFSIWPATACRWWAAGPQGFPAVYHSARSPIRFWAASRRRVRYTSWARPVRLGAIGPQLAARLDQRREEPGDERSSRRELWEPGVQLPPATPTPSSGTASPAYFLNRALECPVGAGLEVVAAVDIAPRRSADR